MSARIPPQNLEAESAIIGGLLLEQNAFDQVADLIDTDDFYSPAHQKLYSSIKELHAKNQPVDLITVTNLLQAKNELSPTGGYEYIASLLEKTFSSANIVTHAHIVREKSLLRKLILTSSGLIEKAYSQDYQDIEALIDSAEAEMLKVGEKKSSTGLTGAMDIVFNSMKKIEELFQQKLDVTGIGTGFNALDKMTSGLHPGELTIIAARPSMGKTAFSLNLASHMALRLKKTVAYFSLEMSKESMMMRVLAAEAKIGMSEIRNGRIPDSSWSRLIQTAGMISEASMYIDDTAALSPFEIRARCRRLKSQKGLDIIMIDYLQLMDLKQKVESRERAVSEISKALKALAKELKVPIIALAQLNRGVEGRSDRRPMLSDLRESGSIEQDADVIMMLYRDDYYDKENPEKQGHAEVIIGKQRNGATGTVKMAFEAKYNRFKDAEPEYANGPTHMTPSGPQLPPQAPPPMSSSRPKNFAPGAQS